MKKIKKLLADNKTQLDVIHKINEIITIMNGGVDSVPPQVELLDGGVEPKKEFELSAGYDLFVPKRTAINHGRQIVPLGFKIAVPKGKMALIFSRSGVAAKGVSGYLSESNGQLCNVKLVSDVVDEEKMYKLMKEDSTYYVEEKKELTSDATPVKMYFMRYREKIFDAIRFDKCSVLLGMVDCGYRGEVGMILENWDANFYIEKGQSIAQMVIVDADMMPLLLVDKLDGGDDARGEQGFNS